MTWIHELTSWPHFSWDEVAIANQLISVRYRQGYLLGRMEMLGFDLKQEASLSVLTSEVVKSSAIEGEILNPEEVRSSLARRLGIVLGGLPQASRDVEGIVEVMIDATQHFQQPLSDNRLCDWHAALFPTGRSGMRHISVGEWRSDSSGRMQVVSGAIGHETVHFEAPPASRVPAEMHQFLSWFEGEDLLDPVLRAGMAHLWFVTIHPFEDGNGRIARAITDLCLSRADGSPFRFYSMSAQIEAERREYYRELEIAQRGTTNITRWLMWFLACLERAFDKAEWTLDSVLYKAKLWDWIHQSPVNDRQRQIINRMTENFVGHMNTSKYAKLAKTSRDTALRDLSDLLERGILIKNPGGGRSTSYRLISLEELNERERRS
jgi:Fic family protein